MRISIHVRGYSILAVGAQRMLILLLQDLLSIQLPVISCISFNGSRTLMRIQYWRQYNISILSYQWQISRLFIMPSLYGHSGLNTLFHINIV